MKNPIYDTKDVVSISVILSLCVILIIFIAMTANDSTTSRSELLHQVASSALKGEQVSCM